MRGVAVMLTLLMVATVNSGCLASPTLAPGPDQPVLVEHIAAVDVSSLPLILASGTAYHDETGTVVDPLALFRANGVNTIRLRVWVDPATSGSSMDEVTDLAATARSMGFRIWIAPHLSDTWADPGAQHPPAAWSDLAPDELHAAVDDHISDIMQRIEPDIIQLGNEINHGFLHPHGRIGNGSQPFLDLLETASLAVRNHSDETRIMLHHAGYEGALEFFDLVQAVEYDMIGLSYYPLWHGRSLPELGEALQTLADAHGKEIVIAETAYPFTLEWYDWTNNLVGTEDQLILPEYPATPDGQHDFLVDLKATVLAVEGGSGFCYWAPEWIAWDGNTSEEGSPWENQALFDADHRALLAMQAFAPP